MAEIIRLVSNSTSIQYLCKKDKRLAKVISVIGPLEYEPHAEDPYPFLVHEIIEQMLSVKAGQKIYSRLEQLCDGQINPKIISNLSGEAIASIGTSKAKASYIKLLSETITENPNFFADLSQLPNDQVIKKLTALHGIGNWTAKMYLIFVLDRQDVLPFEDVAFLQSYKWLYKTDDTSPAAVKKKCKKWCPYSSIAARYLYRALDEGLTHEEFHPFKNIKETRYEK